MHCRILFSLAKNALERLQECLWFLEMLKTKIVPLFDLRPCRSTTYMIHEDNLKFLGIFKKIEGSSHQEKEKNGRSLVSVTHQ